MKKRSIIILTVLMVVFGALTVFATGSTDNFAQTITATIAGSIKVEADSTLTWNMTVKDDNTKECNVTVESNLPWTLEITANNDGYFKEGETALKNPLQAEVDDSGIGSLASGGKVSKSASDNGGKVHEVTFHQKVVIEDPADAYQIQITYTVSHDV